MTETKTDGQIIAGNTVFYAPGKVITTMESCSGQVRWEDGVLEQLWHIQHIGTTGAIEKVTEEWRTVPGLR